MDRSAVTTLLLTACLMVAGTSSAGAEISVGFRDSAGNLTPSVVSDAIAVLYVTDTGLGTLSTSTATWTEVPGQVLAGAWWNLATGAPHSAVHSLSDGSPYDLGTPGQMPLRSVPTAKVNDVAHFLGDFRPTTGEFRLLNVVDASSTLEIQFDFDVVDVYPAADERVSVTSTSDTLGEWVEISEVASASDDTPDPTSGTFQGEIEVTSEAAGAASEDGKVWALPGDKLTVTYYGASGSEPVSSHEVQVVEPAAVPALGWLAIWMLAAVLATLFGVLRQRRSSRLSEPTD